ncbi:uncharacterized protein BDR25DRAFT_354876 [Lindgomyces ingoldianus]|uniref:Uncharacterized protein n=1 Tax=Lindgomyces ingoldianus TaxID=673940 RepID=A0ACB6QVN5_9PLEO|nr:uncharacterized protein BDR25DRAFT_354876 [Lindgomyces ingoldianus]KAF2470940.1 hypothetical protein BDR25DRAFT_354876 [Lindgomyces ingoldianus]
MIPPCFMSTTLLLIHEYGLTPHMLGEPFSFRALSFDFHVIPPFMCRWSCATLCDSITTEQAEIATPATFLSILLPKTRASTPYFSFHVEDTDTCGEVLFLTHCSHFSYLMTKAGQQFQWPQGIDRTVRRPDWLEDEFTVMLASNTALPRLRESSLYLGGNRPGLQVQRPFFYPKSQVQSPGEDDRDAGLVSKVPLQQQHKVFYSPAPLKPGRQIDKPYYPQIYVPDWDARELEAVLASKAHYTLKRSKYPRYIPLTHNLSSLSPSLTATPSSALEHPTRIFITVNNTHTWSLHKILLQSFTSTLAGLISSSQSSTHLHITTPPSAASLPAWQIFTSWLYTLDKIPLPDFTPTRHPTWTTSSIVEASLLSSHLKAVKFESYLLRLLMKELWYHPHRFPSKYITELSTGMGDRTGMHSFLNAYIKWKREAEIETLDPFRWRVEHWYSLCGRTVNWGCNHGMATSGWGGVWERQEGLRKKGRDGLGWGDLECRGHHGRLPLSYDRSAMEGCTFGRRRKVVHRVHRGPCVRFCERGWEDEDEFIEDWCSGEFPSNDFAGDVEVEGEFHAGQGDVMDVI